ncbi:MAG: four helix bundle protein [Candidatus Doudnabacteria bacterium]|jgi:four helix bundle protein
MNIKSFQDIIAWKKSHELALEVYKLTDKYPKHEMFGLISQSRRCAVSVPSNIAEGFRRNGKSDQQHFYNMSQSSLEELRYQLLLARDLRYVADDEYLKVISLAEEVSKLIKGWQKSQC